MICALVVAKFCSTNWVKRGLWFGLGRFFIAKTHARGTGENTGSKRCQRDEFPWWRVTLCLSNTCCIVLIPIRWYLKSAWNKFVCNVFPKQGLICSFSCSTNSALGAVKFHFNTWKKGNGREKIPVTNSFNKKIQNVFPRRTWELRRKLNNSDLEVLFIFKPAIFAVVSQERRAFNFRICWGLLGWLQRQNKLVCYDR